MLAQTANQIPTRNSAEARRWFGPPINGPYVTNILSDDPIYCSKICYVQNASFLNSSKAINQAETVMS